MAVDDTGPHLPGHRHADVRGAHAGRRQSDRIRKAIREAVAEATRRGKLRPNSVDSLTGKNSGDNLGAETPVIHFEQWEEDEIEVKLILKGGGCENKNIQYSLPCELDHLGRADRNLEGVRKCILHAVWQAQGQGCAPGALGVCIGSDRAHGYVLAKSQLFRTLDDVNPGAGAGEARSRDHGGSQSHRRRRDGLRRQGLADRLQDHGGEPPAGQLLRVGGVRLLGLPAAGRAAGRRERRHHQVAVSRSRASGRAKMAKAKASRSPAARSCCARHSPKRRCALKVGDVVLITGEMYTGRDAVHAYLMKNPPPVDLHGAVLYHCGPVMLKQDGVWTVKAAGPTTSIREEPYQADIIRNYGVRAVIGKGGMGKKTLAALKESGAVYLNAIGGAAQYYARSIDKVLGVHLMEFGIPEAMWHLRVTNFIAIVTMDAHGNSLHADVERETGEQLAGLVVRS